MKSYPDGTIVHAFDTKPTIFLPLSSVGIKGIRVVRTITGMGRIFTDDTTKNMALRAIYNRVQRAIKPFVDYTAYFRM